MPSAHPPKHEVFDTTQRTNTDPKEFVRFVDRYELVAPRCLYMRRGMDHPKFGYLESYLLPAHGLRASIFHFRPEVEKEHVRYLDIVDIDHPDAATSDRPGMWHTTDLYLDIVQRSDGTVVVEDTDELSKALVHGFITEAQATRAMDAAFSAVAGIAHHNNDIDGWLRSLGYPIAWATDVSLMPAMGSS
ncbi:DUF402 domain-containing protein [Corynebacterium sp. H78]|uniref:DUF402 domain-containing protein n=1 Tax=Corynebacterium sp. H78 TaxID=3133417 RepID=UPI0030A00B28